MNSVSISSTKKEVFNFMLSSLWHKVFDYAPKLLTVFGEKDGKVFFESFLKWAVKKNLSMGWTMHLHLLNWLSLQSQWSSVIEMNLVKELLAASVIRWSLGGFDHINAKGMIITSKKLPELAVGVWKSNIVGQSNRVVIASINKNSRPLQDSYGISYEYNSWNNIVWERIPL